MISATNPETLVVPIWSGEGRAVAHWQPSRGGSCLVVGGQHIDRAIAIGELVTRFVGAGYRVWVGGGPQVTGTRAWSQRTGDEPVVYAASIADQVDMLHAAHAEMVVRFADASAGDFSRQPLMLVISDFSALQGSIDTISEIAQHARAAKIHLLIGNASPPDELLVSAVRDSIRVRVAMDDQTAQSPLL